MHICYFPAHQPSAPCTVITAFPPPLLLVNLSTHSILVSSLSVFIFFPFFVALVALDYS